MSSTSATTATNGNSSSSSSSQQGSELLRVGFVGAGNMASAIVKGLIIRKTLLPSAISISSPSGPNAGLQALGVYCTKDNAEVAARSNVLILAVKPFMMGAVLCDERFRASVDPNAILVSIAAGTNIADIVKLLGDSSSPRRVIRVMPNTPAQILQGASAMCLGDHATEKDAATVKSLFEAVGIVQLVKENHMDAVTGLSGSGPAYVCMFIEALADGGVASGLPRPIAMALAVQLVKGAATMVQETKLHPGELKDAVASPGGTTIAGIHALETGAFRGTVMSAVVNATKRGTELGKK